MCLAPAIVHVSPALMGDVVRELEADRDLPEFPAPECCAICRLPLDLYPADGTGMAHLLCAENELCDEYDVADGPFADDFTEWVADCESRYAGVDGPA